MLAGQKRTCAVRYAMSALPPKSGHVRCTSLFPLSAKSRHRTKTCSLFTQRIFAEECGGFEHRRRVWILIVENGGR